MFYTYDTALLVTLIWWWGAGSWDDLISSLIFNYPYPCLYALLYQYIVIVLCILVGYFYSFV